MNWHFTREIRSAISGGPPGMRIGPLYRKPSPISLAHSGFDSSGLSLLRLRWVLRDGFEHQQVTAHQPELTLQSRKRSFHAQSGLYQSAFRHLTRQTIASQHIPLVFRHAKSQRPAVL